MEKSSGDLEKRSQTYLTRELRANASQPSEHYSIGLIDNNLYKWEVLLLGPKDTIFENAILKGFLTFPVTYPNDPPTFKFQTEMWHPNIDQSGNVCISILHKPGDDEYGYEDVSERWMPVRDAHSVLLSILLLLTNPNCESPANLEAAHEYMHNRETYNKKVYELTQRTME
jgi:ubiquitin-conjugating enzyme E2 G1